MNKLPKIVSPVKKKDRFFESVSLKKLNVSELTQLLSTANKGRIIFHVTAVGRSAAPQGWWDARQWWLKLASDSFPYIQHHIARQQ